MHRWDRGLDIVVEGTATPATDPHVLQRLADAWATKWDGQWRYRVDDGRLQRTHEAAGGAAGTGGDAIVFRVLPTKILTFGRAPFIQTRHTF